jgi:hypothetical protein
MALKWFKFYPQTWMSGRIMLESHTVKGVFIDCCNLLFTRECDVDEEMLREYIRNDKAIDRLFKREFIRIENQQVVIDWICEEVEGALNRSKTAQEKANKRWSGNATAMQQHSSGNAKRTKGNKTEKKFIAPTEKQVAEYFKENNKPAFEASQFFLYYDSQGWIKSNNIAVKNWKSTARTWWNLEEKSKPKINIIK